MGARIVPQIPQLDAAVLVAGDQLVGVGMDDDVVDGSLVVVVSLDNGRSGNQPSQAGAYRVSQIFRVPSSLPETIHLPSAWKAMEVMLLVWPSKVCTCTGQKLPGVGLPDWGSAS